MKHNVGATGLQRTVVIVSILSILVLVPTLSAFAKGDTFPKSIGLPTGHQPEGIAVGRGTSFYAGSLANGSVYRGDLRTGDGAIVVPPQENRIAVGLSVDVRTNYLYVAGGPSGAAYVYDADTGAEIATFQFTTSMSFVNDVIVTREAAFFTDSFRPFLYRVALGRGGKVSAQSEVKEISLGGEFVFLPGTFNTNGIDATPNGKWLVLVNSGGQALYRVDPMTGEASKIVLNVTEFPNGDGILLDGKTLYVVQNRLNKIAVIKLDSKLRSGTVVRTITDSSFQVPTTVAEFGSALYAVNARFGSSDPGTDDDVVRVSKH